MRRDVGESESGLVERTVLGSGELGSGPDAAINEPCHIRQVTYVLGLCKTGEHTTAIPVLWDSITRRRAQWGLCVLP